MDVNYWADTRAHDRHEHNGTVLPVGAVLPEVGGDDPAVHIVFGGGKLLTLPESLRPVLELLTGPRHEAEVRAALADADCEQGLFEALIRHRALVLLPARATWDAVQALAGVQVRPTCYPVRWSEPEAGIVYIGASQDATDPIPVSTFLAAALWETLQGEDFPATLTRVVGWEQPRTTTSPASCSGAWSC